MVKGIGQVAIAGLGAWALFSPARGAWAFVGAELVFLAWLAIQVRGADGDALVAAAKEPLDDDEAELVRRYGFYFARYPVARECASMLAVLGLASLLLVPWLIYKLQWLQALGIAAGILGVAAFTRELAPALALRLGASKGDRNALRLLAAHDGAARKLSG
jgi:hypothetical protein